MKKIFKQFILQDKKEALAIKQLTMYETKKFFCILNFTDESILINLVFIVDI